MIDPNTSKKGKLPVAESMWILEHAARVSEQSKAKGYAPMNWVTEEVKCYYVSYLLSAALRHINEFIKGSDYNIEKKADGSTVITEFDVLHLENAGYNLFMAAHLFRRGRKDLDDRIIVDPKPIEPIVTNCSDSRCNICSVDKAIENLKTDRVDKMLTDYFLKNI